MSEKHEITSWKILVREQHSDKKANTYYLEHVDEVATL